MPAPQFITKIQKLPYEKRLKILAGGTVFSGIILVVVFVWFFQFHPLASKPGSEGELLNTLKEGAQNTVDGLSDIKGQIMTDLNKLPDNYHAVTLVKSTGSADRLTVEFQADNPTYDVLSIFTVDYSNVTLWDGGVAKTPIVVVTSSGIPFPYKLLSHGKISGKMMFALPGSKDAKVEVANLFFETRPSETFNETLLLNPQGDVKGATTNTLLPRQ